MGTLQTCFWSRSGLEGLSRSSMIAKGSLLGPTELSGLAGGSGLVYTSQLGAVVLETEDPVGQTVWSLKDSTAGGGGCTMVVEEAVRERWTEASPSPTIVPCLSDGGVSRATAVSFDGLCSRMGLKGGHRGVFFSIIVD